MRLRFRSITYTIGRTPDSLERHYRELREAMLRAGQHYGLQPAMPWRPPIDIHETPEAIHIKVELAGVGEDHLDITLYDNALVVSGQRENDIEPDEFVYYHEAQVRYGPFRADILLPAPIEPEAVQATYEHGFLRVRLPKAAAKSVRTPGGEQRSARHEGHSERDGADEGSEAGDEAPGGHDHSHTRPLEAAPRVGIASHPGANGLAWR
jgi:HSP20 family molecular chaperone IbpA